MEIVINDKDFAPVFPFDGRNHSSRISTGACVSIRKRKIALSGIAVRNITGAQPDKFMLQFSYLPPDLANGKHIIRLLETKDPREGYMAVKYIRYLKAGLDNAVPVWVVNLPAPILRLQHDLGFLPPGHYWQMEKNHNYYQLEVKGENNVPK